MILEQEGNALMRKSPGPLAEAATARTISPWVRVRLSRMHPHPSPRLPLHPADWTAEDGEPVREWLLAPDPAVCERIEAEVQRWALRLGLYRPDAQTALLEGPCTVLACAVMPTPDVPLDRIRLTSMYWTLIIAFDDQVVEAGSSPSAYLDSVPELLLGHRAPDPDDPFEQAFAEVGEGIRHLQGGGEESLPEFVHWVTEAIASYVRESERVRDGRLPGLDEYLHDAVANSHILPGMLLQRLQLGLVPPGEPLPTDLDHLARLVAQIARLENDLLSFAKDEKDGSVNACWILGAELGVRPIQAVPSVLAMIRVLRGRHDDLLAAITGDPSRAEFHRQAQAIADWVDACYAWFLTVARYGAARRG